jgi:hypothetical protein
MLHEVDGGAHVSWLDGIVALEMNLSLCLLSSLQYHGNEEPEMSLDNERIAQDSHTRSLRTVREIAQINLNLRAGLH